MHQFLSEIVQVNMEYPESYTLYFNKWSICSQMVQLTLAFRGEPKGDESTMIVEQKEIDILKSEQLEEAYLLEINPKGQVRIPRTGTHDLLTVS